MKRSRELFEQSLSINPKNAVTLHAWAEMEAKHGDRQKARSLFHRAADAAIAANGAGQRRQESITFTAWAILESQEAPGPGEEAARSLFAKAIEFEPQNPNAYVSFYWSNALPKRFLLEQ